MLESARQSVTAPDPIGRLLCSSLGTPVLGVTVLADVYARNAYGVLGVSASTSEKELDAAIARFRTTFRMAPQAAFKQSVSVEYGNGQIHKDPLEILGGLRDPRQRLIWELFWPQIPADMFAGFTQAGSLTDVTSHILLEKTRKKKKGSSGVLLDHALAVVQHNLALASEFDYLAGGNRWNADLWAGAMSSWSRVLENEEFWGHVSSRVALFDDHRVTAADVDELRAQLPVLILGFHRLFCDIHVARGDQDACVHHLQLLYDAPLPWAAKEDAMGSIYKALAAAGLRPLVEQARTTLGGGAGRLTRAEFERHFGPMLEIVSRICECNNIRPGDGGPEAGLAECDQFCAAVLDALDKRLNYQNEERERNLLYWQMAAKRLGRLPVSHAQRQRLQLLGPDGNRFLYGEWVDDTVALDSTQCWFLDGQEADPEASYLIPVYKVTSRQVKVNRQSGGAGIEVGFNKRRILVPRSRVAQQLHTQLPAGCLYVLLAVILGIAALIFCEAGGLDRVVVGTREAVAQSRETCPPAYNAVTQVGQFFESARAAVEQQLWELDVRDVQLHPAALPLGTALLGFLFLLVVVRKVRRARRAARLQRKIDGYQREHDSLAAPLSESGKERQRREARRTRLYSAKSRCEAKLELLEAREQLRRRNRRLKQEPTKVEFVAVKGALSKGYRMGTEPAQSDMEMTYAEREEALALLRQQNW